MSISKSSLGLALAAGLGIALAAGDSAFAAATNDAPPLGALYDLNGTAITATPTPYSATFTAAIANTAITFAFRDDPAFISFSNASLVDVTTGGGNLLTNGDFTGGTYASNGNSATPVGWIYANDYGATYSGVVDSAGNCVGGGACWFDGSVQAYDVISQSVATHVGDLYKLSFSVAETSGQSTFQGLSTNGDTTDISGNGIDVLAYALAGLPVAAPGPTPGAGLASLATLLLARAIRRLGANS